MVREATIKDVPKGALKIEYEPEVDILTIYLQDPETPLSHSSEADPGLVLNSAEDGRLSSIEIMDASVVSRKYLDKRFLMSFPRKRESR